MLFNSLEYAAFLPIVTAVFFLLPVAYRTIWLLLASCYFYMVLQPVYLLVLFALILTDFVAGKAIAARQDTPAQARLILAISVFATCLALLVFKYYNFVDSSLQSIAGYLSLPYTSRPMHLLLPVGLSFHTFQSLSYVFEVYKKRQTPETNFITYATFVMFFPQLVAGPIERPQRLLHQFREDKSFDADRCISGLKRIAWGLFKKCVVADRLALFVTDVYGNVHGHSGTQLTLAMLLFPYQVYCDFSGYSDIAIGSARILGFKLTENFNFPFHAKSMVELWRRWHITLNDWFRDYIWSPLKKRVHRYPIDSIQFQVRNGMNYLIVFTISGLWHGAGWPFVLWGFLNGCVVAIEQWLDWMWPGSVLKHSSVGFGRAVLGVVRTYLTFAVLLVIFRTPNFSDGVYSLSHLGWSPLRDNLATANCGIIQLYLGILAVLTLAALESLLARHPVPQIVQRWPIAVRWNLYAAATWVIVYFGVFEKTPFFYFQF
jgi:alginate O-acetyltransferase complex protein AlgI